MYVAMVCVFRPGLGAFLGEKWLFLAKNCAVLGGHLPTWRHRPGPPPVNFWLNTWIWQGHHLGSRMAKVESGPRNPVDPGDPGGPTIGPNCARAVLPSGSTK